MLQLFHDFPHFYTLCKILIREQYPVWIVGGCLRDLLLQRPVHDIDLVVHGDVAAVVRNIARTLRIPKFPLHHDRNMFRLLPGKDYTIDCVPLQGNTLADDLYARDFTINAMALDFEDLDLILEHGECMVSDLKPMIINPSGGLRDVEDRIIRPVTKRCFKEDPLRMVRFFRFQAQLGFKAAPAAELMINHALPLIHNVAGERILHELTVMLRHPCHRQIDQMTHIGLLQQIFTSAGIPDTDYSQELTTMSRRAPDLACLEHLLDTIIEPTQNLRPSKTPTESDSDPFAVLKKRFSAPLPGELTLAMITKWMAGLPSQFSRADLKSLGKRLAMAKKNIHLMMDMKTVADMFAPLSTAQLKPRIPLIRQAFFEYQDAALGAFLLHLAAEAHRQSESAAEMHTTLQIMAQQCEQVIVNPPSLMHRLNGNWVMAQTPLKPGPQLGSIIKNLQQATIRGEITTESQAIQRLHHLVQTL